MPLENHWIHSILFNIAILCAKKKPVPKPEFSGKISGTFSTVGYCVNVCVNVHICMCNSHILSDAWNQSH